MSLTRKEVIASLAQKTELTHSQVDAVINALKDLVIDTVKKDEEFVLTGFFKVEKAHRKEREGRNPKTGEKITIPAANTVKFSAGKPLKDAVNL